MSYAFIECEKKKLFHFTDVDEIYDMVHIKLPYFNEKKTITYGKKINKILKKYRTNNVVLSNELACNQELKNVIYSCNNFIINGDRLYKALIMKSITDICKIVDYPVQACKVCVFVHEFSIENLNLIKYISKNVKQLVVISENKNRYEKITENLIEKEGIIILMFDAEYKNYVRSDFVINVDFSKDEMTKYNIQKYAIVFSIKNICSLKDNFDGIIINDIDIYMDNELQNFRLLAICEAIIYDYRRDNKHNERKFDKAGYKINGYVGNHGKITEEDFKRVFTKNSKNNT